MKQQSLHREIQQRIQRIRLLSNNRGETIVETMVAFVICLIFLAAISGMLVTSLNLISRATTHANTLQRDVINPIMELDYSTLHPIGGIAALEGVVTYNQGTTLPDDSLQTVKVIEITVPILYVDLELKAFKEVME